MTDANRVNEKLEALRKRQSALKDAIALELVRQQKKAEKEQARLHSVIGAVLVQNAVKHPDFELMLKSIIKAAPALSDAEKKLLGAKGWL